MDKKFPVKLIIHTERIIADEELLNNWFDQMKGSGIQPLLLENIRRKGYGVWKTINGDDIVETSYRIENEI